MKTLEDVLEEIAPEPDRDPESLAGQVADEEAAGTPRKEAIVVVARRAGVSPAAMACVAVTQPSCRRR